MFAVIRNPSHVTGTTYVGKVESQHHTAKAAVRSAIRMSDASRRVNGANTWLDLAVGQVEWQSDDKKTARVECDTVELRKAVQ